MTNTRPSVLLITPFHKSQRGNTLTTRRICDGLNRQGIKAELLSLENPDFSTQLKQHLNSGEFNIIHAFNGLYLAGLLEDHAQLRDYHLVVTMTGTDLNQSQHYAELQPLFSAVRYIVLFNAEFERQLLSCYPLLEEKVVVIPQGVFLPPRPPKKRKDYSIPADHTIFLLPTGLRPIKNADLALDGLEMLARADRRICLLIMGPVIDEAYGEKVLQRINALPWAVYLGEVPHDQIGGFFKLGDVVINCSYAEGQPQAALEAMSLGIPAIMSDVPGNRGIIEAGRQGFYIKGPEDLCQAAHILHTRPELRRNMGRAAAQLVEDQYDYNREIKQHIDLYRLVLQT